MTRNDARPRNAKDRIGPIPGRQVSNGNASTVPPSGRAKTRPRLEAKPRLTKPDGAGRKRLRNMSPGTSGAGERWLGYWAHCWGSQGA
jgi:hypothetical protein